MAFELRGRYWDRTSDLFGVNAVHPNALTSTNTKRAGQGASVVSGWDPFNAVQRHRPHPNCSPPDSARREHPRPTAGRHARNTAARSPTTTTNPAISSNYSSANRSSPHRRNAAEPTNGSTYRSRCHLLLADTCVGSVAGTAKASSIGLRPQSHIVRGMTGCSTRRAA
jgi:hypothetical protein